MEPQTPTPAPTDAGGRSRGTAPPRRIEGAGHEHHAVAPWALVAEETVPTADLFLDDRGSLLRVRWDEETQQLTLSVWRDGTCVATHRLDRAGTARLASLTTQAWVESLRHVLTES